MTETVADLLRDVRNLVADEPREGLGQLELVIAPATPGSDDRAPGRWAYPAEVREEAVDLLRRLIGVPLSTVRGHRNLILGVMPPNVLVATMPSPDGRPVPVQQVQHALDILRADGSVVVDPEHLGHRSSFIGAVLLTLPGVRAHGSPPIVSFADLSDAGRAADAGDNVVTFEGSLTHARQVEQRGEQAVLRRLMFRDQDNGRCALCGETYPVRFLYAAHIKRRSVCGDDEKRDLSNIAMAACAFGCDAMFEAGYLTVGADGLVMASGRGVSGALGERLNRLQGKHCPAFTPSSQGYFEWHRENVFRR